MTLENILANLNASQKAAVSSAESTVAILAGPGSGKTHTLTSRTAWLLRHEGLQPWNVIVATFTVKAAREMKERIGRLIGDGMEAKLILGTFHSIARRYLARYGHLIHIRRDFGIADSSDSLGIIRRIIKRHNLTIDPAAARTRISSRKARGGEAQPFSSAKIASAKSVETQEVDLCYAEYEEALARSNLLDYDDLLLRCVDLLRAHPSCVSNVEAVLIDEFQDTNLVQFDLMRLFASHRKRVTIVGDPDQSIYGFRSAETKNFKRMLIQYPDTVTIPLEENYRSSGSILLTALEVIQQDESRISKSLLPTHNVGTRPVLRKLSSAHVEAQWIITEIKRTLTLTGDLMAFSDIAILLRSASLSRHIESALGKAGIAYRMVGGHRFFDRVEIKILLDYLRVISQPDNNDALARVINVPSRRIGETTVKALLEEAEASFTTLWKLVRENAQGIKNCKTKFSKQTEQGLSFFVNIVLSARKKFLESTSAELSIAELIEYVIKKINFEEFLEKSHPDDHEARWANVQELINQASDFTDLSSKGNEDDEALPEVDGLQQDEYSNPLSKFLANIALASDMKANENSEPQAQVTISTIHAAKGLEWPVVFIPAAYEGSIPHSRAEDADEERRLLYVAMTRAKALLYMSCPIKNSQREQTTLSPFLAQSSLKPYLANKGPSFKSSVTQSIAQILNRPLPTEIHVRGLESLEDDLWPVDGNDIVQGDRNIDELDGSHHYTQGQRPPKRVRTDSYSADNADRRTSQSFYSTTMNQSTNFSTETTTLKSEFVTAGSHLKLLSEKTLHCASSDLTSPYERPLIHKNQVDDRNEYRKPRKIINTRNEPTIKEKRDITNYFGKFNGRSVHRNENSQKPLTQRVPLDKIPVDRQPLSKTSHRTTPTEHNHYILPALADHRLRPAVPPILKRKELDHDAISKKAYIFLSSSPPRANRQEAKVYPPVKPPAAEIALVDEDITRSRPATSMHVTTTSHMNTLRKTLGIRRDMNGWSNRKGRGFVAPSMSKHL